MFTLANWSSSQPRDLFFMIVIVFTGVLLLSNSVCAGEYLDSAHGSVDIGVYRPIMGDSPPMGFGYSRGNCAHCHELHGSISGAEPSPVGGQPSEHSLFAENFNADRMNNPYMESDNICFSCHNSSGSVQWVINNDYSQNFGCAAQGVGTVMAAFNQNSYHNLYDVWSFSEETFSWFSSYSNPCSACHNPHLARRNWANSHDPLYSAISKPTDHFTLWGVENTMARSYAARYEPPYCSNGHSNHEPDAISTGEAGRAATPDYVGFCISCHTNSTTIFSTTLGRNLKTIDWGGSGDKHGLRLMDGTVSTKPPYDFPSNGTNFVLSCLDCHEPHGSDNVMLIRRRTNSSDVNGTIALVESTDLGNLCVSCHKDDLEAGSGNRNSWEYVHHLVVDAPYTQNSCANCHISETGGDPISCYECHFHGSYANQVDGSGVFRIGF